MTESTTARTTAPATDALTDVDPSSYVAIASLAIESHSAARFYRDVLACVARALASLHAGLHVGLPTETVRHEWSDGETDAAFWRPATQEYLTEALASGQPQGRLYRSQSGGLTVALLAAPLRTATGDPMGAVSVLCPCSEHDLEARLMVLTSLADFTSNSYLPPALRETSTTTTSEGPANLGRALKNAAGSHSSTELAFSVINQLQAKSGCDQCALGSIHARKIKVRTISGFDDVKRRSPGVIQLQQAMEECADHGNPVVYQRHTDNGHEWPASDFRLHRQWHESSGGDAVACVPLRSDGKITHVLSLRRGKEAPFSDEELDRYRELVEPYATALQLLDTAHRNIARHALDSSVRRARVLLAPGRWLRKALLVAALAFCGWFLFGTMPYRIHVACQVVPAEVRIISVHDGAVLRAVHVTPGDRVTQGQVLCSFASETLALERLALARELEQVRLEKNAALALGDRVTSGMMNARAAGLTTRIELLDLRIQETTVRAPHDGEIISGDLRKRVGDRLATGDPLFELAPSSGWLVELRIPEASIAGVKPGLEGRFTTFSRPEFEQPFWVLRVAPSADPSTGRNLFRAEGRATSHEPWIRPGMEGVARLEIADRPVWWVTLHRAIEALQLNLWF